ncbi:MAG TPA: CocE/NonD family hydrolase [Kofleriaceae bacterium]|nr:CocE/NonD family hydrolase [Kofleriaceae bacterium]
MTAPDAWLASEGYARTRPPLYAELDTRSERVVMRDGVTLAIDVHLPRGATVPLPAIVRQTRYFRSLESTWVGRRLGERRVDPVNARMRRYFVARGYAWIDVDVRGSGASEGVWHSPWSPLEVADGAEIVAWIARQPWSNGRVGSTGNSYDGTAAELLATQRHPALRAIAPRCSLYDVFTDVAYPGGLRQAWFTAAWTRANQALDANHPERMVSEAIAQGHPWWEAGLRRELLERALRLVFRRVRPVGGDHDAVERLLAGRATNLDVDAVSRVVEYRDDVTDSPLGPRTADTFSPSAYLADARAAGIPILGISGWFDAAYPHGAIKRHLSHASAQHQLVLGPWNHGVGMNVSPHAASRTAGFALDDELLRFFDQHLLDRDTGTRREARVRYYVMGAETWRIAPVWPPPDVAPRAFYLAGDRTLPSVAPAPAVVELAHDPDTGSGRRSRWRTLVSPFVVADYPDRAERGRALLVFRSLPLVEPVEIAGHAVVELTIRAHGTDAALFAYLEEETADRVRYVTEGQQRLVHQVVERAPLYTSPAPYRSYLRADARPLVPGEATRVAFDLLPVAYRFAAGSRIRLALATTDRDHFAPLPDASGLAIELGGAAPSALVLPARPA